jgi:hypothetical protein
MNVRYLVLACMSAVPVVADDAPTDAPAVDMIVGKMIAADHARTGNLTGYTGTRHYFVENTRFKMRAKMKVEVSVDGNGVKTFRIVEASGPGAIRKMVFNRMLDTEAKASAKAVRESTQISPANYSFRLVDTVTEDGRKLYVLEAEPKTKNQLLFRGRVWVDATEFAVVRIEGAPAKNPSFWVKKTKFVHTYAKVGDFWLGLSNESETDVRIFGHSVTRIDYSDYRLAAPSADAGGEP